MRRLINWWRRFVKQSRVYQLEQWISESRLMPNAVIDEAIDFREACRKELKQLKDELESAKS